MAQKSTPSNLSIVSLRGGQNNTDSEHLLPEDQCLLAENVEFYFSALGERRNGCVPMSMTASGLDTCDSIVHISQQFPTNDPNVSQVWVVGATEDVSVKFARRSDEVSWYPVVPLDAVDPARPLIYQIYTQSFQNKHFFFYKSSVDRLHVWDGTSLRRVGLAPPVLAPVVANTGSGSYSSPRYFRVRYIVKSGSQILLRSEPSPSTLFSPSGSGSGALITKPASVGEGETHWELEGSANDDNYYVIQTLAVGTATATDSTASPISYANFDLSEQIGLYLLPHSARFGIVEGNRLVLAGHFTDPSRGSQLRVTPVSNSTEIGNEERLPLDSLSNNTYELDNYEGGSITGLSQSANGVFYIFKWSHIYQATRTGNAVGPYDIICLSKTRGALPGSVFSGMDEYGQACIYFLDPLAGPSRLGVMGLQVIHGLRRTWVRVNRLATGIVSHGIYYPEKRQAHWWVAADSSNYPNLKLILQVTENKTGQGAEVTRGWSIASGRISEAYCSAIINVVIRGTEGEITTIARRPYIGLTFPDLLQQCDLLSTDAGHPYIAKIITRPYILTGLLNKWGVTKAVMLANANTDGTLLVRCVKDFNVPEVTEQLIDFKPDGNEAFVIRQIEELNASGCYAIQFIFSDPDDPEILDTHDITF